MLRKYMRRQMRADNYTAETLERMADEMPSGYAEQAGIMREHARKLRSSSNKTMIELWEEERGDFQSRVDLELPAR